jgi:hypothetical protein
MHDGRRELRRRAATGVVHEVEEERCCEEARSGHHATGSTLHGPRPSDLHGGREEGRAAMVREGEGRLAWEEKEREQGPAPTWEERVEGPVRERRALESGEGEEGTIVGEGEGGDARVG